MSGFIINLAVLHPGTTRVEAEASAAELDLPPEAWPEPILGTLLVDKAGEAVNVRGRLEAVASLECVRCLRKFDWPVAVDISVFADRIGSSRALEADLERDDYMKFHDGRQLDLREETREELLLELPISPRCREECRGLCPKCGADLNQGPCGCPGSA